MRSLDAVFFAKDGPDISLIDGHFHITYRIGGMSAEFVLPPNTFFKALRVANRLAREFSTGNRNVVSFRSDEPIEERDAEHG